MLSPAKTSDTCWWCESAPADSREHKLKRSDLVRRYVLASRSVDLRAVYGTDWQPGRDGLLRYLAKHVGCRLAENNVEVPPSIRRYLDGGPEPRADLALEFEIRADIAAATKTALSEGSMWLGDVYFSELDTEGRALVIESHYGYRWLRVAWGVGSDLEGYPWPFRAPFQPLPHGPTEPRCQPSELPPFG